MIIGITGLTGSGKTTALQAVKALGGSVIDCDKVYHDLLCTDTALLRAIDARFPGVVKDGVLDRKALAAIVFSDPDQLLALNAITHSAVREKVLQLLEREALCAIDAIELFDGGLAALCDVTVGVVAPEKVRLERLTARDCISEEQAQLRMRAQKSETYFREKCEYILENAGTKEEFYEKCLVFFKELIIIKENQ